MIEPISTAAAMTIAKIAFDKFIEGGAGELGKKVTEGITQKVQQLAQAVWPRLKGNQEALKVLEAAEKGSVEDTQKLKNYLDALWTKNPEFGQQVQQLAKEIHFELTRNDIQAENVQQIFDGQGLQVNNPAAPTFQAKDSPITINYHLPPKD
jgi:phenylalanyl-tRNA synthetase alpha subunit